MPISKSELASIVEDLKLLPETMRLQAEMLVGKGCTLRRVDGGLEVVSESGSVIADFAAGCVRDKQASPPRSVRRVLHFFFVINLEVILMMFFSAGACH
jgi:hypothetical protein